jgi:hypothetical protein
MTEISPRPNMDQVAAGQPNKGLPAQPSPQIRGSGSTQPSGRPGAGRKPLFRS